MPRHLAIRIAILMATLPLLGAPAVAAQEGHALLPATPVAAGTSDWQIVESRPLEVEGQVVTLSPDGQWLAGTGDDFQLCVWNVVTLQPTCAGDSRGVDVDSIQWAPDSSAVAWSLDALRALRESDIYLLDLATGTTTNLTDDGQDEDWFFIGDDGPEALFVDTFPAFTPDSQALVFARTDVRADTPRTDLMRIPREGGEPALVHTAHETFGPAIASPILPLADGTILYAINTPDPDDETLGAWRLDPDGTATRLMDGSPDAGYPIPALIDVRHADAGYVASGYSWRLAAGPLAGQSIAFELDVTTGNVTPLGGDGTVVTPYRYAPDGQGAVAAVRTGDAWRVVIHGADGGESDLGLEIVPSPWIHTHGISWSEGNTLLVHTQGRFGPTLVTVANTTGD